MFGHKLFSTKKAASFVVASLITIAAPVVADNINVNGANRNMLVYAPSGIEKNRPLIIQMHGYNQDAAYQKNAAKWEPIADTARFVVVFPNGENKAWDTSGDKDLNFIKAIINEMNSKYGIDKNRVYVSGFSMGGMMSYVVANKMSDQIAAIAPVSGGGSPSTAKRAMPIMHTHGTTDDVVNYNSTVNTLKSWVPFNKCSSESEKIKPYPTTKSGSAASLEIWSGCSDGVEVRLLTIDGKGHWYSMDEAVSVNTSVEIWNFVKNYSLAGPTVAPEDSSQSGQGSQGNDPDKTPADSGKSVTPDTGKVVTPSDSGKTIVPTDTGKVVTPADSGKVIAPSDSGTIAISRKSGSLEAVPGEYSVFSLSGKRLGTIDATFATEAESLKKAGFDKGVYVLRARNGMIHRVMVTK